MTVMYTGRESGCPHNHPVLYECKSVHIPDVGLCGECMAEWVAWHARHPADTYSAQEDTRTCAIPCPGFQSPGGPLAPFKPGEDPISDKTRSTLGRLFGGDITE